MKENAGAVGVRPGKFLEVTGQFVVHVAGALPFLRSLQWQRFLVLCGIEPQSHGALAGESRWFGFHRYVLVHPIFKVLAERSSVGSRAGAPVRPGIPAVPRFQPPARLSASSLMLFSFACASNGEVGAPHALPAEAAKLTVSREMG